MSIIYSQVVQKIVICAHTCREGREEASDKTNVTKH